MATLSRTSNPAHGGDPSAALAWLKSNGTRQVLDGMARYGIPSTRAFGVSVGAIKAYGQELGKNHELALALWSSGWYEARLLAAFVAVPTALSVREMDAWARDFDNWAVCDTVCFHAFDRSPLAWERIEPWARVRPEFHKRAAFALLWGLSVHDKQATDQRFLDCLPLIEAAASDARDYVKKGVDMSLRALGKRNAQLRSAALELATRLTEADGSAAWIGRSTLRDLSKPRAAKASKARPAKASKASTAKMSKARPAKASKARPAKAAKARSNTAAKTRSGKTPKARATKAR